MRPINSEMRKRTGLNLPGWVLTATTSSSLRRPTTAMVSRSMARKLVMPPRWSTCRPMRLTRPGARTMHTFSSMPNRFP